MIFFQNMNFWPHLARSTLSDTDEIQKLTKFKLN